MIGVPVGLGHDAGNRPDGAVGHVFVKQVADRVHEDPFGTSPPEWRLELFGNETQIKIAVGREGICVRDVNRVRF